MQRTNLTGISLCVFDAYGTIFDLSRILDSVRGKLGAKAEALSELWRRKQLEYSWLRSLMGCHADFWHVTGEALDFAFRTLGIVDPSLRARLMQAHLSPLVYPDAKETLDSLQSSGTRCAILSNGSPSMLTSAIKASGLNLPFDSVMSAEGAGTFKPHPSVYKLVMDRFGKQPGEIAFVSANGWDAAGAAACGLRVVWVNRHGAPREELPKRAEIEIASLAELAEIIRP